MKNLLRRAHGVYRTEGLGPVLEKTARFVPRYVRHVAGTYGLYSSQRYLDALQWLNTCGHTAVADPFTVVYVDPDRITTVTARGPNPGRFQWQDLGKIQRGDWDQSDQRVEDLPVVRALREHFEDGKDWDEVEFIRHVLEQAERGHVIWRGCSTEEDVRKACARVDRLYEQIREHGYKTKQTLVEQGDQSPDKYCTGDGFNRYDEVIVDIGRDGQFLFVDGRHRLAIAKILGLEEIPVRISARHERWQRIRELAREADSDDRLPEPVARHRDHPDLEDVLEEGRNERA